MPVTEFLKLGSISAFLVFFSIFILTSSHFTSNQETSNVEVLNFSTDKKTYGSYEDMKISVLLKSSKNLENVSVNVFGIRPRVYAYVNETKIVNLKKGENEVVFLAKTPYCTSGCGGVYPGPYDLYVKVFVNGEEIANSKTTINLVQG
jgi:hypothetical protein